MGLSQVVSQQFSVDLEVMAMKRHSTIAKTPRLVLHHQTVECDSQITRLRGLLPLYRDVVNLFYSPRRLDELISTYTFYC